MADGDLLTVGRALDLLALFTTEEPEWGVSEAASRLGLAKSQVHRLFSTLAGRSYVVAEPRSRRYRLGPALIGLGHQAIRSSGVRDAAQPVLQRLAVATGRSALLNLHDGARYRLVAAADSPGELRSEFTLGRTYPWYGGAAGHAIYAFRPQREVSQLLELGFEESTPRGPRSAQDLSERHRAVRQQGWSRSVGEYDARVGSLAAPVLHGGEALGSVALLCPEPALDGDAVDLVAAVLAASAELTALLDPARARPVTPDQDAPADRPRTA